MIRVALSLTAESSGKKLILTKMEFLYACHRWVSLEYPHLFVFFSWSDDFRSLTLNLLMWIMTEASASAYIFNLLPKTIVLLEKIIKLCNRKCVLLNSERQLTF